MRIPRGHLRDWISVYAKAGRGFSGPAYSATATTMRVRVELGYRRITDNNGQDIVVDGTVFVHPTDTLAVGDKVTYGTQNYTVVSVQPMRDGNGNTHHSEATIKSLGAA